MSQANGYGSPSDGRPTVSAAALLSTYEKIAWQITVDGRSIPRLLSFTLRQSISAHHSFELRVYHTELEDARAYRIDKTRDLLGKTLTAVLGTHQSPDITRFAGIITSVSFEEKTGLYGEVVIRGASPTILLEGGAHMHSFLNKNLQAIVQDTVSVADGGLKTSVRPRANRNIEYTVQYGESRFAFLQRLAAVHGEWFLYDGETLHFGRPQGGGAAEVTLQYARHIEKLRMDLSAQAVSADHLGYRAVEDQPLRSRAAAGAAGLNFYGDVAVQHSEGLWSAPVKQHSALHAPDQSALDHSAKTEKAARAAESFVVEGTSRHPAPRPGLRMTVMMGSAEMGQYLITETVHTLDNVNNYNCAFKALAPDLEVLPVHPSVSFPKSGAQIATVTSNADPAGQGRVQVRFPWQEGDNTTPWIRVSTPDGGSSGARATNRGFVFIPEAGDQVMVDFEHGAPDAPFVLCSLFHGGNGAGGGADNVTKSISTRSGHLIELNDTGEGTHIIIRDPGGNEIHLDTKGKNITITAPETITMNAKNVVVNAGENITMNAGSNIGASAGKHVRIDAAQTITENAGKDYMLNAENITKIAVQNITSNSDTHTQQAAKDITASSTGGNIFHHAKGEVRSNSGDHSNLF